MAMIHKVPAPHWATDADFSELVFGPLLSDRTKQVLYSARLGQVSVIEPAGDVSIELSRHDIVGGDNAGPALIFLSAPSDAFYITPHAARMLARALERAADLADLAPEA